VTSPGEILLVGLSVALALAAVVTATRGARRARVAMTVALAVAVAAGGLVLRPRVAPARADSRALPKRTEQATYVGSAACRACHPSEYASFGRTFHRTMTQDATTRSVLAPLGGALAGLRDDGGRIHRLEARGDEVWATLPDPDAEAPARAADVTRRVIIATGSHREQAYWVAGRREGELRLFPFVWLVRERRFVPRSDAFLVPPDAPMPRVRWNSNCIACHAVAGEPGHDPGRDAFDTRVAELGIACEACHGPGAEHVARHRDPVERYVQHASKRADPTIIQPRRLPPERSAAVCGQCHAYAFPRDEDAWWSSGYARSFRAGDTLTSSRVLLDPGALASSVRLDAAAESLFWPDGSIRVGGREYNGLVASPCYERGEGERKLTCLSCHSMHTGEPSAQIAPDRTGDRGCTQCHAMSPAHSHHAAGSPGAACVACHMPRTSYALFSAIRSHRIDSPRGGALTNGDKPNACNLCHLDKSLAWTSRLLGEWYGAKSATAPDDVPEGARGALSGNAAVRVVVADAMGRPEAIQAGGATLAPQILAELLVDPYAAVRFVAARSLRALPGYADVDYDFLAPPDARARAHDDVLARFSRAHPAGPGLLDPTRLRALLAARDARAITIAE
jgi:hypothetical protein